MALLAFVFMAGYLVGVIVTYFQMRRAILRHNQTTALKEGE